MVLPIFKFKPMELEILRTYHTGGTNGILTIDNSFQCYTIELPWRENLPQVSCVPEGRYELKRRYSSRFKAHLWVCGVPGRSLILLHPANDATKELEGCIAPVSRLCGEGKGEQSKAALRKLLQLVCGSLEKESVFLTLKTKRDDTSREDTIAHAEVL